MENDERTEMWIRQRRNIGRMPTTTDHPIWQAFLRQGEAEDTYAKRLEDVQRRLHEIEEEEVKRKREERQERAHQRLVEFLKHAPVAPVRPWYSYETMTMWVRLTLERCAFDEGHPVLRELVVDSLVAQYRAAVADAIEREIDKRIETGEISAEEGRLQWLGVTKPQYAPLLPLRPSERFSILKRDGYRCRLCGVSARSGAHVELHVDHITPRKHGGTNDPSNLWTLCAECNRGKGTSEL